MAQFAAFPFLHFPRGQQRWLASFPAYALQSANGAPIGSWVQNAYDPNALAAWLDRTPGRGSYAGIYKQAATG